MSKPRTNTKPKNRNETIADREAELFMKDVESVRKLLIRKKAEDLIPMLSVKIEEYKSITQLTMPLGAKK